MKKPLTVLQQETTEQIVTLINNSELPAFILIDILERITNSLVPVAEKQYQEDLERYNQQEEKAD